MSNNTSLYHNALFDDGSYILRQVVTRLYQGGSNRPDIYFHQNEKLWQKYCSALTNDQRQIIESSGAPYNYDIAIGAVGFDVSILSYLVEHTCDLPPSDDLLVNVLKVKNLKNIASYSLGGETITNSELCNKLDSLLVLYITILNGLEHHALCYLHLEKQEIRKRIHEKKIMLQSNYSFSGQSFVPQATSTGYVSSANIRITTMHEATPVCYVNPANGSTTVSHNATSSFYVNSANSNTITTHEATPPFYVNSANSNTTTTHEATPPFYVNSANSNTTTTHEATPLFYVNSANSNTTTTHEATPPFYVNSANSNTTTTHEATPPFYVNSANSNTTTTHEATPPFYVNSANSNTTTTHEATPPFYVNSANKSTTTSGSRSEIPAWGKVALGVTGEIGKTACGVTGEIGKTACGVTGEIGKTALGVTGEIGKTALGIAGGIGKTTIGVFGAMAGVFTKDKPRRERQHYN